MIKVKYFREIFIQILFEAKQITGKLAFSGNKKQPQAFVALSSSQKIIQPHQKGHVQQNEVKAYTKLPQAIISDISRLQN